VYYKYGYLCTGGWVGSIRVGGCIIRTGIYVRVGGWGVYGWAGVRMGVLYVQVYPHGGVSYLRVYYTYGYLCTGGWVGSMYGWAGVLNVRPVPCGWVGEWMGVLLPSTRPWNAEVRQLSLGPPLKGGGKSLVLCGSTKTKVA
jgi:hypothetical protein